MHHDDLKSLDDLQKFPFTTKDHLRNHYPFGKFAIPAIRCCVCTLHRAPPASPRWLATAAAISTELRRVESLDENHRGGRGEATRGQRRLSVCHRDLAHHIKEFTGVTATVRTVKPGTVERSLGKAERVIDLRSKS